MSPYWAGSLTTLNAAADNCFSAFVKKLLILLLICFVRPYLAGGRTGALPKKPVVGGVKVITEGCVKKLTVLYFWVSRGTTGQEVLLPKMTSKMPMGKHIN